MILMGIQSRMSGVFFKKSKSFNNLLEKPLLLRRFTNPLYLSIIPRTFSKILKLIILLFCFFRPYQLIQSIYQLKDTKSLDYFKSLP